MPYFSTMGPINGSGSTAPEDVLPIHPVSAATTHDTFQQEAWHTYGGVKIKGDFASSKIGFDGIFKNFW
jgi:hypothetical protein